MGKKANNRIPRRFFLSVVGLGAAGSIFSPCWLWAAQSKNWGQVYHQKSKYSPVGLLKKDFSVRTESPPPLYKTYPQAEKIKLPDKFEARELSVEEAIEKRRSERNYSGKLLSLSELSKLLHYADGITSPTSASGQKGFALRAAPSGGAVYPIEIYPIVNGVKGLKSGVYHYSVKDHALELLKDGDYRDQIAHCCLGQRFVGQAKVVLVLTSMRARMEWKYKERTYRYVMAEAGHIAQNVYLVGQSMNLGVCAVGSFYDDQLNRLLDVDGKEEAAIYVLTVGKKQEVGE